MHTILFRHQGKEVKTEGTLLDAIKEAQIPIKAICNGTGRCGLCKVIVEKGEFKTTPTALLTKSEIRRGIVLACLTFPMSNMVIKIPNYTLADEEMKILNDDFSIGDVGFDEEKKYGIAIDIGTTTLVMSLVDLVEGDTLTSASRINPQVKFGGDVITRINYAIKNGGEELQTSVVDGINKLLKEMRVEKADKMVISGNTTMVYLLLGKDPTVIKKNDQLHDFREPHTINTREIGINLDVKAYIVPGIANYVGGDITSDILRSKLFDRKGFSILVDVGTNGEVAIGNSELIMAASTSAGPSFEGGEVRCGMTAAGGAIEDVDFFENAIAKKVIGAVNPKGICGSGMIALVSGLFTYGIIDRSGNLDTKHAYVRMSEDGPEFVLVQRQLTQNNLDISIDENEIKNIIRSKAAIYAGIVTLMSKLNLTEKDISRIYIAGGFGNYLNMDKAITLGLLPDFPREKFEFIGNGSLLGAKELLLDTPARILAEDIALKSTYLDLNSDSHFMDEFVKASFIPHTDLNLFPSVKQGVDISKK